MDLNLGLLDFFILGYLGEGVENGVVKFLGDDCFG